MVGEPIQQVLQGMLKLALPPLLSLPAKTKVDFTWAPRWLPQGSQRFHVVAVHCRIWMHPQSLACIPMVCLVFSQCESRRQGGTSEQSLRQGRRTVQTEVRNNVEITVVGELPPSTAKRIADSVVLESTK